jgi:hypothetical protein
MTNSTLNIIEQPTTVTIVDDIGISTVLNITDESVQIIEVAKQGMSGTSYSIVADRTELTGQVELIAGDNVSLDVDNENKTITVNSLSSDKNYIHNQLVASSVWTIIHNLDKHPSVTVVDSSDSVVVGDISYDSLNQLTVVFSAEFGGKAYVN